MKTFVEEVDAGNETKPLDPETERQTENERQVWGGRFEFLLSCLSYAIGLGNIWRFPYLCYMNGGGAFLLPFLIMLFAIGIPTIVLEMYIGQFWSTGPVTVWKISPIFTGLGWTMASTLFFGGVYYQMLVAWTLYYIFQSFIGIFSQLPWSSCPDKASECMTFSTIIVRNLCKKYEGYYSIKHNNTCLMANNRSWHQTQTRDSDLGTWQPPAEATQFGQMLAPYFDRAEQLNSTESDKLHLFLGSSQRFQSAASFYFSEEVLSMSDGLQDLGWPRWQLVLCLLAAWIITFLCLIRGIQSAGKVAYFTTLFPYVVLTVLLVRGLTLEGSSKGLLYFFIPKWERLAHLKVWGDAAIQVFFTLSSGSGGIIALSSYNKFHNNALIDAVLVAIGDGFTSIYAGAAVFCVLGYMSHISNVPIDQVVQGGAGLAFKVYPDLVTTLPLSPLWALLFFIMLVTLGFGTIIANVNAVKTAIADKLLSKKTGWLSANSSNSTVHIIVLLVVCVAAFLMGVPLATRGGVYLVQLMDNNCATYSVLVASLVEMLLISWVYGIDKFMDHVTEMRHGQKLPIFWKFLWMIFTPLLIVVMLGFKVYSLTRTSYEGYTVPIFVDILFWMIPISMILIIPVYAVILIATAKTDGSTFLERITNLSRPRHIHAVAAVGAVSVNGDGSEEFGFDSPSSQMPLKVSNASKSGNSIFRN